MKKLSLFSAAVILLTLINTAAFSQSATARLNITLSDVVSISVTQPSDLDVNFDTEKKYTDGIKAVAADHITVVSSRGYIVKAVAGDLTGTSGLTAGSIKISASTGSNNAGNVAGVTYATDQVLPAKGIAAANIVTAGESSWKGTNAEAKFNITYSIGEDGVYAGKPTGTNVIPVIYTVTTQ